MLLAGLCSVRSRLTTVKRNVDWLRIPTGGNLNWTVGDPFGIWYIWYKRCIAEPVAERCRLAAHRSARITSERGVILQSASLYRMITGPDTREWARSSLGVATTCNKKQRLQQVQMAVDFNWSTFKRELLKYGSELLERSVKRVVHTGLVVYYLWGGLAVLQHWAGILKPTPQRPLRFFNSTPPPPPPTTKQLRTKMTPAPPLPFLPSYWKRPRVSAPCSARVIPHSLKFTDSLIHIHWSLQSRE